MTGISQMLTERDFTLAEISTLGREYQALKKRFEGAADARKNAPVLSALSRLGTAPASSRPPNARPATPSSPHPAWGWRASTQSSSARHHPNSRSIRS